MTGIAADAYIPLAGLAHAQFQRTITERQRDRLIAAHLANGTKFDQHMHDSTAGKPRLR